MNIAILDDSLQSRLCILDYIKQIAKRRVEPIYAMTFETPFQVLDHIDEYGGFDLYILDIYMPYMTGLELAKVLRERNEDCQIIFQTVSKEHALESFNVNAFQYYVKPIDWMRLESDIIRLLNARNYDNFILINTNEGIKKIYVDNILFIEIISHRQNIYLADSLIECTLSSYQLEELLQKHKNIFKTHRNYLVNIDHVVSISQKFVELSSGDKVDVSKRNITKFKTYFKEYFMEKYKSYPGKEMYK